MLRIKELCKKKYITQAELAGKMGISASALAQSISGNPSLDRLESIAKALNVSVGELFQEEKTKLTALAYYGNKSYKADSVEELHKITDLITIKQINENEKEFLINKPYAMVFDIKNNKAELFNRKYQLLGETEGTQSVFTIERRDAHLHGLTEEKLNDLFENIHTEGDLCLGRLYSNVTSPFTKKDTVEEQLQWLELYNYRLYNLSLYIELPLQHWYSIY
ncbi:helix-turn-helix transcriptional regulator [uncultured Bacteroides sp.]|uniref:helix-turn-helix domain-containing protein n=1 Tax=uncultured Bacteroides sp. TaxID=162156 RepID=UPI002AA86536|nr:helix-turn-helix transcriptional regulator [uncultured Bacteroides sp.]